jgi:hypothetical protein
MAHAGWGLIFLAFVWGASAFAMGSAPAKPAACPASAGLTRPNPLFIHSHNDYGEQVHPLFDALAARIPSVEADVWYAGFDFKLSHFGFTFVGTLEGLYLNPLQNILNRGDSVLGDEHTFYLWLDIKDIAPKYVPQFVDLLRNYPMLTHPKRTVLGELPLTVILTGEPAAKARIASELALETVIRDSNDWSAGDPSVPEGDPEWQWYAISWSNYLDWDGNGAIPADQKARLNELVGRVHATGRRVRFWDNPETPAYWSALEESGADMIGARGLPTIREYFNRCLPPN